METLRTVLAEIVHLFVDDGSLALALVAWCTAIGVGALWDRLGPAATFWAGAGFTAIALVGLLSRR